MLNLIKKKSVIFCYKLRLKQKEITKRKKKNSKNLILSLRRDMLICNINNK